MYRLLIIWVCIGSIKLPASCQPALLDTIVNLNEVKGLVSYLSSDTLKGRLTGTQGAMMAAQFIANEFWDAGLKPVAGVKGYLLPFSGSSKYVKNEVSGFNVLGVLPGKTKAHEIIVFSAHYDHLGTLSTNQSRLSGPGKKPDSIFNGANDNASGTAAVILLARYFAALNDNERTLLFVAFAGEEQGVIGSTALLKDFTTGPITAMINIEMIGRTSSRQIRPFITGGNLSDVRKFLNNNLMNYDRKKYGKFFYQDDPYPGERLFMRSDNWPFAGLGVPAHTIMLSSPLDEFYHTVDDDIQTLDPDAMTQVITAIALSCRTLVDGSATPRRIK